MSFKVVKAQHVIAVEDFDAAVAYFTEKLGFAEYNRVDGWSFLQLGDFWLMVGDCQGEISARDTGNHSWFAYVNCEGIDDLYQQYLAREVPIREPIADKPWGLRGRRAPPAAHPQDRQPRLAVTAQLSIALSVDPIVLRYPNGFT